MQSRMQIRTDIMPSSILYFSNSPVLTILLLLLLAYLSLAFTASHRRRQQKLSNSNGMVVGIYSQRLFQYDQQRRFQTSSSREEEREEEEQEESPRPELCNNNTVVVGSHHVYTAAHRQPRYAGPTDAELTDEQRQIRSAVLASRPRTGLSGPFGPWLAVPHIAGPAQALGKACRYGTSLSLRESELVILLTGARMRSHAEFDIHVGEALKAGLAMDVIAAIPRDDRFSVAAVRERVLPLLDVPGNQNVEREKAIVLFTAKLLQDCTVSDRQYDATKRILGGKDSVLVEITSIIGYYQYVALVRACVRKFVPFVKLGEKPICSLTGNSARQAHSPFVVFLSVCSRPTPYSFSDFKCFPDTVQVTKSGCTPKHFHFKERRSNLASYFSATLGTAVAPLSSAFCSTKEKNFSIKRNNNHSLFSILICLLSD